MELEDLKKHIAAILMAWVDGWMDGWIDRCSENNKEQLVRVSALTLYSSSACESDRIVSYLI